MLSNTLATILHRKNLQNCPRAPDNITQEKILCNVVWTPSCHFTMILFWTGYFFNIWLLQMSHQHCSNLADIAQKKSRADIEQKYKILRNKDIAHVCWSWLIFPFYHDCSYFSCFLIYIYNFFCHITFHTRCSFAIFVRDFLISGFPLKF